MQNDIKITHKDNYIHVECIGEYSLDKARLCIDMMVESCEEHNCSKVLADVTKQEATFTEVEKVLIADHMKKKLIAGIEKLALLATKQQVDPTRFFEMAAANRGIQAKTFTSKDEALGWLKVG